MLAAHTSIRDTPSIYEAALEKAISDGEALGDRRSADVFRLAEMLLKMLPPSRRALYASRIERLKPAPARGTPVFDNVVAILSNKESWTAPTMKEELSARGIDAEAKQINNVLQYLAREGRLHRVSRGHYYVTGYGVGIVTSDYLLEGEE